MEEIAGSFRAIGQNAREVFLLSKLDQLMRIVMRTVGDLKVDQLTGLGGLGAGGNGTELTGRIIAGSERIKAATGVDLLGAVRDRVSSAPAQPQPQTPGSPTGRTKPPEPPRHA
jgi:flotillin